MTGKRSDLQTAFADGGALPLQLGVGHIGVYPRLIEGAEINAVSYPQVAFDDAKRAREQKRRAERVGGIVGDLTFSGTHFIEQSQNGSDVLPARFAF